MADFNAYHALGQNPAGQPNDPRYPPSRGQNQPPNPQPHITSTPVGYQQVGAPHDGFPQQQYGVPPQQGHGAQGIGYFPTPDSDVVGGITAQMGGLGLASDTPGVGSARTHRRKERHAYHDISQPPGSSQGMAPASSQFLQGGQVNASLGSPAIGPQAMPGSRPGSSQLNPGDRLRSGEESVATQGRVDPEQIPSIPRSRDVATQHYLSTIYPTMEKHTPPPAAIPFIAHDQGNSSPKFARLTINNVPSTAESLSSTALPLGLVLQPLAPLQEGEQPIPVLDFGEAGPPRCRRCRTYINPFMMFRSGGNKLVCNMCNFPNDVAPEYFAPTDPSGVRVDRMQRPELMMGTVEYLVPKEYWAKEPVGLRWLFLIDVTQEAVNRGLISAVCQGIMDALYGGGDDPSNGVQGDEDPLAIKRLPPETRIGIVTFDKEVHFYNLSSRLEQAQMMVMTDLEEPFVPLSEGLFVDPYESKDVISSLLTQLPTLFSNVKNPEPALLPTLNAALAALSTTGGKIVCSLSMLPTWGPGRLMLRDDGKGRDTDAERRLFTTEHPGFKKTASTMVSSGIGVDFFLAAAGGGYMDIATIGHVSAMTGGEVFFYPNFLAARDTLKFTTELKHAITRETGYQALMKVRCSNGLQVSSYHGSFLQNAFGADLEIGTIDADKALGVIFSYDGQLDLKIDAHFQAALLYTTASGQRRVRCINLVAGVSEGATETMRTVDQDAVVNIIAKEASSKMAEKSLKDIRAGITEKTIDILAGYRKNFSGSHPPGQLVLPENLKEFAMYMLSLIKSRAFKGEPKQAPSFLAQINRVRKLSISGGVEPTDRRVHSARFMHSCGTTELALYLYPRIYPLHNLTVEDCFPNPETGQLVVPPTLRASYSRVEEGGVYIVDNGQILLIWLHAQVSPNLLEDLFGPGMTSLSSLPPTLSELPVLETHLNAQVRNLLQYLSTVRGSKAATIQLARQGLDGSEFEFARMLVEDRNNEAQVSSEPGFDKQAYSDKYM
jgi:protein transport protein SEC24